MTKQDEHIGLDAWLLAVYFAIAPMHQTLVLPNGSTVVKYIAFGVMILCVLWGYLAERRFILSWELLWPLLLMFGWFALTFLWAESRSSAISSLITIGSYCVLMLIVGSRMWNSKEKVLFMIVLIISCTFYAIQLINDATTTKRATLSYIINETENEADQNVVACNVGLGALTAFFYYLQRRKGFIKWAVLIALFIMLTGIICTGSRGGLVAISAGILYMIFKQSEIDRRLSQRYIIILTGIPILFWLIFDLNIVQNEYISTRFRNTSILSLSERFELWGQYLELLIHRPIGFLLGYGYGCASIAHASYMGQTWLRSTHNDIISILCQTGIPGLLLTYSFVHHIWKSSKKKKNVLGCACILLMIIGSLDINLFRTYGWWNAMIIAYIGVGTELNIVT